MVWKSVFFFQNLKANLSYKVRSNSYSSFRGKWWPTKPAQTEKKHGSSSKTGIMFPSNSAAWGKILPNKTWMANFSCGFLMVFPKFGEDVSHFFHLGYSSAPSFQTWNTSNIIQLLARFFRKHNYPISRVRRLQRCCARIGAACHTKMDMWMKFRHCII